MVNLRKTYGSMEVTHGMSPSKNAILKIPRDLADDIDKVLEAGHFASRVEFAREAIRRLLREYGISLRVEENPRE